MDSEGWVDLEQLLMSLCIDKRWELLTENDLRKMIDVFG
ncbi:MULTISPECIES: hypothetical protein [Paenibacillus]